MDIWGYYKQSFNSNIENTFFEVSSNEQSVIIGSLKEIIYPTGSKQLFEFESNKISSLGYRDLSWNDFVKLNPNNSDIMLVETSYNNISSTDPFTGIPQFFTLDFDQDVVINGTVELGDINNESYLRNLRYVIKDINSNIVESGRLDKSRTFTLQQGSYTFSYINLNWGSTDSYNVVSKLFYRKPKSIINNYVAGAGIRIKQIKRFSDSTNHAITSDFIYDSSEGGVSSTNSINHYGVIDGDLSIFKKYPITQHIEYQSYSGSGGNGMEIQLFPAELEYIVKEQSLSPHISLTKSGTIGYSKVIVKKKQSGLIFQDNGKSVYQYTTAKDYPTQNGTYFWPFFPLQQLSFKHGLLIAKSIYNESDILLMTLENKYEFKNDKILTTPHIFKSYGCPQSNYYTTYNNFVNQTPDSPPPGFPTTTGFYGHCSPGDLFGLYPSFVSTVEGEYYTQALLKESTKKDYLYNGSGLQNIVTTTTDYEYNPNNLQVSKVSTTNSKGEVIENKTYYPGDGEVSNEPFMSLLEGQNRVTTPVLQENYVNGQLTGKVLNKYRSQSNITPNGVVATAVLDEVQTSKDSNNPLEPRLTYHRYDEYGNIREVSKQDGTRICYIYGYNKTLPIAKVEGLSYEELAGRLGLGSGNQAMDTLDNFSEQNLSQINNLRSQFTVENPFLVTTYDYEVGVGIKEVIDPRGRKMTYHYDEFHRLKYVKDQEGNILSENEYKYATQN